MPDLNSLPPSRSPASASPSIQPRTAFSSPGLPSADSHPYLQRRDTPSPRSSSISLAAAATMNAADISRRNSSTSNTRRSPRMGREERARSTVAMSLSLNDPTLPGPGELSNSDHRTNFFTTGSPSSIGGSSVIATGDPHHHQRNPSLGEIHQELEQEQEAQVVSRFSAGLIILTNLQQNRLLQMIRTQQLQLEQMRQYHQDHNARQQTSTATNPGGSLSAGLTANNFVSSTAVIDDSTPTSELSFSIPNSIPFPPAPQALPRGNRRNSQPRTGSSGTSPALRPHPIHTHQETNHSSLASGEWPPSPVDFTRRNSSRDESAYYQAETATLTRENQMLRLRIRELERQVHELNGSMAPANAPLAGSSLTLPTAADGEGGGQSRLNAAELDKD